MMHAVNVLKSLGRMIIGLILNMVRFVKLKLTLCVKKIQSVARPLTRRVKEKLGYHVAHECDGDD